MTTVECLTGFHKWLCLLFWRKIVHQFIFLWYYLRSIRNEGIPQPDFSSELCHHLSLAQSPRWSQKCMAFIMLMWLFFSLQSVKNLVIGTEPQGWFQLSSDRDLELLCPHKFSLNYFLYGILLLLWSHAAAYLWNCVFSIRCLAPNPLDKCIFLLLCLDKLGHNCWD